MTDTRPEEAGPRAYELADRYTATEGEVFLTGVQALARIPVEQLRADRRAGRATAAFVSGYPGSPLGGYDSAVEAAARLAPDLPIVCRPAVNEELAATAVMGSQLAQTRPDVRHDGVVGVWYGKAPGVDRASDALRHGVFAGAAPTGGVVALVGDDPSAKSSTIPSSSAGVLADLHIPVLYPADPAEALDLGRHAIALSRASGLWSALKIVADVADGTASVELDPDRVQPLVPTLDGRPYRTPPEGQLLTPRSLDLEREIHEIRYPLAVRYASLNRLNHCPADPSDAWIGLVASGITYREVREALGRLGLPARSDLEAAGIRLLKMQMPLPFDPDTLRRFARGLDEVLVIEEKQPDVEILVKDALYSAPDRPLVVGKTDETGRPLLPGHGALDADTVLPSLRARLERRLADRLAPPPEERERVRRPLRAATPAPEVARAPFFCSGCPHNRSTEVPPGTVVGAGIGCHTMVALMDPERVGDIVGITCMGSEGAQWIGMAPFVDTEHLVQNLGDGTFFHSGRMAVEAAVAAGVDITYKLLFNGAIAMTGGQTPQGERSIGEVTTALLAMGVAQVLVTTDDPGRVHRGDLPRGVEVWDRTRLLEAQERLARVPGVTVLIHDQACAAEARRARKRGLEPTPDQRVVINPRICEGCGDCGQVSNCLSVQPVATRFGRKTRIDQTTCNLDYSCLEGDCPAFMTVTTSPPGRLARLLDRWAPAGSGRSSEHGSRYPTGDLPDPELIVPADDMAVRITGIGGTGVVTVAQVVGTAAMLEGFSVRGLDQIGLSQKAGPVVSDLRLGRDGATQSNRLGAGQADLLLVFDQLVGASDKGLVAASPERTVVVGSTSVVPTGAMITHPDLAYPDSSSLGERIASVTRPGHQYWADAAQVTTDLFGDAVTANVFVVGMAVQAGALPLSPERIEEAIELNGVAVARNLAAFRWGRCQIVAPETVAEARRAAGVSGPTTEPLSPGLVERIERLVEGRAELDDQLRLYASELVAFADEDEADGYLDVVGRVARAEHTVRPGSSALTATVAANLFKLTAYKDEYEVARLMLQPDGLASLGDVPTGRRMAWRLHPPVLKALGLQRKISVPAAAAPAVRLLARGKRLRGTPLDPFGWSRVRRLERSLPGEYVVAVDRLLARLDADGLDRAVRIAGLPDMVRGYEELKLARIAAYRDALVAALADGASDPLPTTRPAAERPSGRADQAGQTGGPVA